MTFPPLSDRQKQVVKFALKFIGYPYIWAGEYPTPNSPYGTQKSGGFDCSGFVFYVMKMHFGYDSITVNQRGAHDMAAVAKPRITRDKLKCGDLIFFGPKGPSSSVESIYHAGLYLGQRLVHPLDGLERRRHHLLAEHLDILQAELRLGPPGAHGGRAGPAVALGVSVRRAGVPMAPSPAPSPQAPTASARRPILPVAPRPRQP